MSVKSFANTLGKELRERDNQVHMGMQEGVVSKPFPDIEIKIGGVVEADKDMLVIAEHLKKHKRKFNITTSYTDPKVVGSLQLNTETDPTNPIVKLTLKTKEDGTSTCEIEFVDELKVGDKVIVMPSADMQTYYVLDRVGR